MPDKYELLTQRLFSNRFGLELRKIPEAEKPTPDFDVFAGGQHVAVLEVKALESPQLPGASSRDNCAGRVAKKLHEAVRQFEDASSAKVLVLINDDDAPDKFDFQEALLGSLMTEDGYPFSTMPRDARVRARDDKSQIDLYVWVEESSGEGPSLVTATSVGRDLKSRYFARPVTGAAG